MCLIWFHILNTEYDDASESQMLVEQVNDHYGTLINRYPDAP